MGLAASQARLLTLTSRLSSIELKQQSIANAKILLANDSEAVSSKYTTALNNQTLLFSDGKNETELSYENLAAAGYTVRRTGDGVVANSAKRVIQPPTVPKPESLKAPALEDFVDKTKPTLTKDVASWNNKLASIKSSYGEYPATVKQTSADSILRAMGSMNFETIYNTYAGCEGGGTNHLYNKANATKNFYDLARGSGNGTGVVELINDKEDWSYAECVKRAKVGFKNLAVAITKKIGSAIGVSNLEKTLDSYIEEMKNGIVNDGSKMYRAKHGKNNKAYNKAQEACKNGHLVTMGIDDTGTDEVRFYCNVSDLLRRLLDKTSEIYCGGTSMSYKSASSNVTDKGQTGTTAFNFSSNYNFTFNSRGLSVSQYESKVKPTYDSGKYTKLTWNQAVEMLKGNKVDTSKDTGIDPSEQKAYEKSKSDYEKQYNDSLTQWNNYEKEVEALAKEGKTPAQALAEQLKSSSKFLIQGLLSGYLTLMKDGKDVSLSSSTDILTKYDKSDDAQAEAEYEAEMKKINRKEKLLDNQMKQLDTEHSAMQQEINSVKSIIQRHAEKDFSLFA